MNHPDIYKAEISRIIGDVGEDLKILLQSEFDNDYTRADDDPMIKIKSILGSPIIGRLRVNKETNTVQCQYCFRNDKTPLINNHNDWIDILEIETLNIYEGLFNIYKEKNNV